MNFPGKDRIFSRLIKLVCLLGIVYVTVCLALLGLQYHSSSKYEAVEVGKTDLESKSRPGAASDADAGSQSQEKAVVVTADIYESFIDIANNLPDGSNIDRSQFAGLFSAKTNALLDELEVEGLKRSGRTVIARLRKARRLQLAPGVALYITPDLNYEIDSAGASESKVKNITGVRAELLDIGVGGKLEAALVKKDANGKIVCIASVNVSRFLPNVSYTFSVDGQQVVLP